MSYGAYFLRVGRGCGKCQACNTYFYNPAPPCTNVVPVVLSNSETINTTVGSYVAHSFVANESNLVDMGYAGGLPAGLSFTNVGGSTCYLTGIPSVSGVFTLQMQAMNYCGWSNANAAILTLNIASTGGGGGGTCSMPDYFGSTPGYFNAGTTAYDTTYNVSSYFTSSSHNVWVWVYNVPDGGGTWPSRFILKADGTTLVDTGCFTDWHLYYIFLIPAGTNTLEAIGICGCGEDPSTQWPAPIYWLSCE